MASPQQFYLTLPSNSSLDYYPNNTPNNYITHLPRNVRLEGGGESWEVALVEVHYPCAFQTIGKDAWIRLFVKRTLNAGEESVDHVRVTLEKGDYKSVKDLIDVINEHEHMKKESVSFTYDEVNRQVTLWCRKQAKGSPSSSVVTVSQVEKVKLSKNLALQLGYDPRHQVTLRDGETGVRPADIRLGLPSQLYVYCDLVEPQLVGDTVAPLLRIVNLDTSTTSCPYGSNKTVHFQDPHYVAVMKSAFETVEIDLRDDTGAPLPFLFGTTCMKLHLRRVVSKP